MRQILVIENEYDSVRDAFDFAIKYELDESLEVKVVGKSQELPSDMAQFFAIFIDISLSNKSVLDGFGIIDKIRQNYPTLLSRCAIITGNNLIEEAKEEHNISDILIIQKPLSYKEIASFIIKAKTEMR